jgi:hypothetical protein
MCLDWHFRRVRRWRDSAIPTRLLLYPLVSHSRRALLSLCTVAYRVNATERLTEHDAPRVATSRINPGLDALIAQRFLRPRVEQLAAELTEGVRAKAPDASVWVSQQDDRVRSSHREADGQTIPDNLRFAVPKADADTGVDMARRPRDTALPLPNRAGCRCEAVPVPGVIASLVQTSPPQVRGARVSSRVGVRFPRIAESEFPSDPDGGGGWMRQAASEVASRSRLSGGH